MVPHVMSALIGCLQEHRRAEYLKGLDFSAHAIYLPHSHQDCRFLLRVLPGSNDNTLPHEGDSVKVTFVGVKRKIRHASQVDPTKTEDLKEKAELELAKLKRVFKTTVARAKISPEPIEVLGDLRRYFKIAPADEELSSLLRKDDEEPGAGIVRLERYVTNACEKGSLQLQSSGEAPQAQDDGRADRDVVMSAEIVAHHLKSEQDIRYLLVTIPLEPANEVPEGQERQPILVDLPMLHVPADTNKPLEELLDGYITDKDPLKITITTQPSDKTARAEVLAIDNLFHPQTADKQAPVSRWSREVARWLLDFPDLPEDKFSDLFKERPYMANILRESTRASVPDYLQKMWAGLDQKKKLVYESLCRNPLRTKWVSGVAGCGKTHLIEFIILMMQFGDKDDVKHIKVLHCVPSNIPVNDFANRMAEHYRKIGIKGPQVVRLHNFENEVSDLIMQGSGDKRRKAVFNAEEAERCIASLTDKILAHAHLSMVSRDVDQSRRNKRHPKIRELSLHSAAFEYYREHTADYATITAYVKYPNPDNVRGEAREAFAAEVNRLYKDFLAQFNGVVATTPVAAGSMKFRLGFGSANLVTVDEASRISELSLQILIARNEPELLFVVGDPCQLPVHVNPNVEGILFDPFQKQRATATLSRIVLTSFVDRDAALNISHRMRGHLHLLPSEIIYGDNMIVSMGPDELFCPSVSAHCDFLQAICPDLPTRANRLLVEMPESCTGKIGKSTYNRDHVNWVLEEVVLKYLRDERLTSIDSLRLARLLIMPLYSAQVLTYQAEIDRLALSGRVQHKDLARIEVRTLDSSQGAERDLVVVDFTKVEDAGFCTNLRRLCVALTRSIQGEIVLLNRGMHSKASIRKHDDPDEYPWALREVYHFMHNIKCHKVVRLAKGFPPKPADMEVRCHNCGQSTHFTGRCPEPVKCSVCQSDEHSGETCTDMPKCSVCDGRGHLAKNCPLCRFCKAENHTSRDCPKNPAFGKCHRCGKDGHMSKNCPEKEAARKRCFNCESEDHVVAFCPKPRLCKTCPNADHLFNRCPNRPCKKCNQIGHLPVECPVKPTKCSLCRETGHYNKDCPERIAKKITEYVQGPDGTMVEKETDLVTDVPTTGTQLDKPIFVNMKADTRTIREKILAKNHNVLEGQLVGETRHTGVHHSQRLGDSPFDMYHREEDCTAADVTQGDWPEPPTAQEDSTTPAIAQGNWLNLPTAQEKPSWSAEDGWGTPVVAPARLDGPLPGAFMLSGTGEPGNESDNADFQLSHASDVAADAFGPAPTPESHGWGAGGDW